jgi:hypothetical protein
MESFDSSTAMYEYLNLIPWRVIEPGIFCSGRDDQYATPPWASFLIVLRLANGGTQLS